MKITILQLDIARGDVRCNIGKAEAMMACDEADLYVLPEMWSTGYYTHPEAIAEDEKKSEALTWMKQASRSRNCAICGSLAIMDSDGHYRNRLYFVSPEGVKYYDKRHLFTYAHEDERYASGDSRTIVDYRGMRFLLLVCYDLRFPVWSRYGRAGLYDAIIYVANWPSARLYAWATLLCARAIENQCYVIAVNRVGEEKNNKYDGGSTVIDPHGRVIVACPEGECTCGATIDRNVVETLRKDFPVLNDRDNTATC